MRYQAYPEYRKTGLNFIQEVPETWEVRKLKFMASIENGRDYKHVESDDGFDVIGSGGAFVKASEYLYDGESVLFGRKGTIDTPLYINGKFWTVDTMFYSVIQENTVAKYLYYCAIVMPFKYLATQTTLPSMTQFDLENYFLAYPKKEEQEKIVEFLDRKTKQIDQLIEKKKALIEKLNEQRIAVITRAVTKGLDETVPMKESGVEWLGQVPERWDIVRIKFIAKLESGHTPSKTKDEYWVDCDIPWVSLNDSKYLANNDYISDTKYKISLKGLDGSSARLLPSGAVVFTRDASIGLTAITTTEMAVSQHLIAWLPGERILSEFLLRIFISMESVLNSFTFGSTIKTIGMDDVKKLVSTVPPLQEQIEICRYIKGELARIDRQKELASLAIVKITEYRTALITDAVTGKIDVRNIELNQNVD